MFCDNSSKLTMNLKALLILDLVPTGRRLHFVRSLDLAVSILTLGNPRAVSFGISNQMDMIRSSAGVQQCKCPGI